MDLLHRVPADVKERRDIADGEALGEPGDRLRQTLGHPLIAIEPRELLAHRAAAGALEPRVRKDQPEIKAQKRQVAHAPLGDIVDRGDRTPAPATALHRIRGGLELDHEPLGRQPERIGLEGLLRRPPRDLEPLPASDRLHEREKSSLAIDTSLWCLEHATTSGRCHLEIPEFTEEPNAARLYRQHCTGRAEDLGRLGACEPTWA